MITQARLKELLHYCPDTGVFTRLVNRGSCKKGSVAGWNDETKGKTYTRITIERTKYKAHRLAWLYVYGSWPVYGMDHIDGDSLNNKITNLRDVPQSENCKNRVKQSNNSSGFNGVSWRPREVCWRVTYSKNKTRKQTEVYSLLDAVALKMRVNREFEYHCNHGQDRPTPL